ncbi:DegT/DnrJ/EryC1/StrS family aminotransferase [Nocardia sp. NPDC024068]|uniref:DegT/DnrJ/EryC1/StrS family aminotransferase n=1 Tax=Nocardia sp. NPDC024068 TaxID=3157197 RepID=UPI0033C18772
MTSAETAALSVLGRPLRNHHPAATTTNFDTEREFVHAVLESGHWGLDSVGGRPLLPGAAIDETVAAGLGVEQARAAAEFAHYQQVPHAVPVSSGTRAIVVALMAAAVAAPLLGRRALLPGMKVLVPGLTWQATPAAPVDRRLAPVFLDIDPATGVLDTGTVVRALEADRDREIAAAVIPDLYCRMVDMPEIARVCAEYGVTSIEDCAHAHGGVVRGRPAGSVADFGTWSFQSSKSIGIGEGGMISTPHGPLVDQLVSLTTCGRPLGTSVPFQAGNERLPALGAALLRARMRRFYTGELAAKQHGLMALESTISDTPGLAPMTSQPHVDRQITYKVLARAEPGAFAGLPLPLLARAYAHLLGCEVTPVYEPLDRTDVYQPLTDPANRWSESYFAALDPRRFDLSRAHALAETTFAFEHAVLLDPDFPELFIRASEILGDRAEHLLSA